MPTMNRNHACRCALRRLSPALLAVLSSLCGAVPMSAAAAPCESLSVNEQEAEAVCVIPVAAVTRQARFKAHFLGSHDDSIVSLQTIELNAKPVACVTGSKTQSRFEDGEVTLDCGFSTAATSSGGLFKVKMSLHHLQLDKTELVFD